MMLEKIVAIDNLGNLVFGVGTLLIPSESSVQLIRLAATTTVLIPAVWLQTTFFAVTGA